MDVQPDNHICKDCEHRAVLPNPQTREFTSYCTRYPPTVFGVATPNGIGLVTTYPPVSADHVSCGEWEPEIQDFIPLQCPVEKGPAEKPFNTDEMFNPRSHPLAGTGGSPVD